MPALPSPAMRSPTLLGIALLLQVCAVSAQAPPSKPNSLQYLKGGDPVMVHLSGAPGEVTIATYVQRGGSLDVAPAGTVQVDGLSAADAAQQVKTALEAHFMRPGVSLTPIVLADSMFFIAGDVRRPGGYAVTKGMTVRQAVVAVAGNVTSWCQHPWYFRFVESCAAKVSIVRPDDQGNLELLSTEVTDWFNTGGESVHARDMISVRVVLSHSAAD